MRKTLGALISLFETPLEIYYMSTSLKTEAHM